MLYEPGITDAFYIMNFLKALKASDNALVIFFNLGPLEASGFEPDNSKLASPGVWEL